MRATDPLQDLLYFVRDPWPWGKPHEAAGIHRTSRQRCGGVAARGARAAGSQGADDRVCRLERGSLEPMDGSLRGAIADLTETACILRRYPRSPKLFLPSCMVVPNV